MKQPVAQSQAWGGAIQDAVARAAPGSEPVYRKRGASKLVITRADVEVDIDMENTEVGCYMWGSY